MIAYIVRRLGQSVFVIIAVSLFVFLAVHLLPGDPALLYLSRTQLNSISQEDLDQIREEYGLNDNILIQYGHWVEGAVARGDFGESLFFRDSVGSLIAQRLPTTLYLGILAMIIQSLLGMAAGTLAALRRGTWLDSLLTALANIGITIPAFLLGIILIYVFAYKLGWFPINGFTSPLDDFWLSVRQTVLPVLCLIVFGVAAETRLTRSSMLEVTRQDYVRSAVSRGLTERAVTMRHILKNGIIPTISFKGIAFAGMLGGAVFEETVFGINGIGRLAAQAVQQKDYAIVQAICLLTTVIVVVVNLIIDVSYGWLDPRVRYS